MSSEQQELAIYRRLLKPLAALLAEPGPHLLDGAMGTELARRGFRGLPEAALTEAPWLVKAIHAEYAALGARLVLTATLNVLTEGDARAIAPKAVALAREAAPDALVAADLGPGVSEAEAAGVLAAFAAAGADLAWAETQLESPAARALVAAAHRAGLECVVTFAAAGAEEVAALADAVPDADAVGWNCLPDAHDAELVVRALLRPARFVVAKPNAGRTHGVSPEDFAEGLKAATRAGARLVGGCCGAGPAHLAALARALALAQR